MRIEKIAGHRVEFYDSIDELPIVRYQKFNKMLLVDSGVGSDVGDFDNHIEKIIAFIGNGNTDLAVTELGNMRQNLFFVQNNLSPRYLSFAALVKSIDGRPCSDVTDEGLQRTLDILKGGKAGQMVALLMAAKKKIDEDLLAHFPAHFDTSTTKDFYDLLRKRTLMVLDCIISGATKTKQDKIDMMTMDLLLFSRPQDFTNGKVEVEYDRQFEKMCVFLSEELGIRPKESTVIEFYAAYEHLTEKIKNKYKRNGKSY